MMNNLKIFLIFFYFFCNCLASAQEKPLHHQDIEQFVYNFISDKFPQPTDAKLNINVSSLDPRIKIKPCSQQLEAKLPERHNNRHLSIKVFCQGPQPWHIYLTARVSLQQQVVVARQTLDKGSVLDKNNLTIEYIDTYNLRGEVYSDKKQFFGAKARRRLAQGQPVTKKGICLVCKGDSVTLIAKSSEFTLKTVGVAMENGFLGEQISVKNKKSGKMVEANVSAVNKVIINL